MARTPPWIMEISQRIGRKMVSLAAVLPRKSCRVLHPDNWSGPRCGSVEPVCESFRKTGTGGTCGRRRRVYAPLMRGFLVWGGRVGTASAGRRVGVNQRMRSAFAVAFLSACLAAGLAEAAQCPHNPDGLGTSRVLVVDPTEHMRLGTMQYSETLPLADREVVLTFDDGPLPPYTTRILDILAAECVKATYFLVGRMARNFPELVRRIYYEGHTVGTHSQNHPLTFHVMSRRQGRARDRGRLRIHARGARRSRCGLPVLPHPRPAARTAASRIISPRAAS